MCAITVGVSVAAVIALLPIQVVAIIAIGTILLVAVAAIMADPVIGLALTLFFAVFAPLENIMFQLPVESGQVLIALTAISWLARTLYRRKAGIVTGPLVWPLLLFTFSGFISFFASNSAEQWAKECLKWVEVLFVYVLTVSEVRNSSRSRNIILAAILASTLFEACLGVYQFGLRGTGPESFQIAGLRYYRSYGTFEQPNPLGGYMGLAWPFMSGFALYTCGKAIDMMRLHSGKPSLQHIRTLAIAMLASLAAATSLLALITSWSRGAWIGAVVALAIMLTVALRKPVVTVAILGVTVVLTLILNMAGVIPQSVTNRFTSFLDEFASLDVRHVTVTSINHAVIERLAHWQAAENMIIDKPWSGVGFGNYGAVYDVYRTMNWPLALGHAHNYYLNVFAETGVFGLMAYLILWLCVFLRSVLLARPRWIEIKPRATHLFGSQSHNLRAMLAFGLVGTWTQLSVHQVVDNLFVANIFLLIGVLLGLLDGLQHEQAGITQ